MAQVQTLTKKVKDSEPQQADSQREIDNLRLQVSMLESKIEELTANEHFRSSGETPLQLQEANIGLESPSQNEMLT